MRTITVLGLIAVTLIANSDAYRKYIVCAEQTAESRAEELATLLEHRRRDEAKLQEYSPDLQLTFRDWMGDRTKKTWPRKAIFNLFLDVLLPYAWFFHTHWRTYEEKFKDCHDIDILEAAMAEERPHLTALIRSVLDEGGKCGEPCVDENLPKMLEMWTSARRGNAELWDISVKLMGLSDQLSARELARYPHPMWLGSVLMTYFSSMD